jgi:hypothetical protein
MCRIEQTDRMRTRAGEEHRTTWGSRPLDHDGLLFGTDEPVHRQTAGVFASGKAQCVTGSE